MREENELTPKKIIKKEGISFTMAKKYLKELNEDKGPAKSTHKIF